jgi:hypothetical protein
MQSAPVGVQGAFNLQLHDGADDCRFPPALGLQLGHDPAEGLPILGVVVLGVVTHRRREEDQPMTLQLPGVVQMEEGGAGLKCF